MKITNSIFIVGIKGVAMANIAVILKKMGKRVVGSDTEEEQITDELLNTNNISWTVGFNTSDLPFTSETAEDWSIIYSAAHGGSQNSQVQEAKKKGVEVIHQALFLDGLMTQFKTKIAVCGSHGKTTTASLLSYALIKLGANPSYLVGAPSFNEYPGGDYNGLDYFVLEADEYAVDPPADKTPKFNFLNPDMILCTNIDWDHPDVFENRQKGIEAFQGFFKRAKKVILCPENEDPQMDKVASNEAGVEEVLLELGFEQNNIKKAMKGFTGAKRRFEQRAYLNDTYLFDDYAHHPAEIEMTLRKAKDIFKERRIVVLFQSHTYSRTKAFLKEFGLALAKSDICLIAPIFPSAREDPKEFNISSFDIAKAANSANVEAFSTFEELLLRLKTVIKKRDVIFTMGAGDIYRLEDDIIRCIENIGTTG